MVSGCAPQSAVGRHDIGRDPAADGNRTTVAALL
jgi:hypothetical protein